MSATVFRSGGKSTPANRSCAPLVRTPEPTSRVGSSLGGIPVTSQLKASTIRPMASDLRLILVAAFVFFFFFSFSGADADVEAEAVLMAWPLMDLLFFAAEEDSADLEADRLAGILAMQKAENARDRSVG